MALPNTPSRRRDRTTEILKLTKLHTKLALKKIEARTDKIRAMEAKNG